MPFSNYLSNCMKCLSCSERDVLLGSSNVSSPQHKPHQLDIHPGQHSANGNLLVTLLPFDYFMN